MLRLYLAPPISGAAQERDSPRAINIQHLTARGRATLKNVLVAIDRIKGARK